MPRSHPRVALPLPAGRLQAGPSRKTNMGLRPRLLWTLVGCLSLQATPTSAQKQNMCDSSPPQLCRQRCPMVTCPPPNLCGMRRGDCCDVVCLTHQEAAQTKHNQGQQRGVTTAMGSHQKRSSSSDDNTNGMSNDGRNNDGQDPFDNNGKKEEQMRMMDVVPPPPSPSPPLSPSPAPSRGPAKGSIELGKEGTVAGSGPPDGCTSWFDGCNSCHRQGPTGHMQCSLMNCAFRRTPECRGWARGSGGH